MTKNRMEAFSDVPRQLKFFMLVSEDIKQEAGVAVGDLVEITVALADAANSNEGFYSASRIL